jgi:DNA-binding transcriptional MocR family regulator
MTEQVTTAWDQRFSSAARGMRFSAIRRMSALIEKPGIISFAPGQPSPDTFPVEAFGKILEEILAREGAASFQYILTRGLGPLLGAIREYASAKGIAAAASEVLVTEGASRDWTSSPACSSIPATSCSWSGPRTSAPPPLSGPRRRAWSA